MLFGAQLSSSARLPASSRELEAGEQHANLGRRDADVEGLDATGVVDRLALGVDERGGVRTAAVAQAQQDRAERGHALVATPSRLLRIFIARAAP